MKVEVEHFWFYKFTLLINLNSTLLCQCFVMIYLLFLSIFILTIKIFIFFYNSVWSVIIYFFTVIFMKLYMNCISIHVVIVVFYKKIMFNCHLITHCNVLHTVMLISKYTYLNSFKKKICQNNLFLFNLIHN